MQCLLWRAAGKADRRDTVIQNATEVVKTECLGYVAADAFTIGFLQDQEVTWLDQYAFSWIEQCLRQIHTEHDALAFRPAPDDRQATGIRTAEAGTDKLTTEIVG